MYENTRIPVAGPSKVMTGAYDAVRMSGHTDQMEKPLALNKKNAKVITRDLDDGSAQWTFLTTGDNASLALYEEMDQAGKVTKRIKYDNDPAWCCEAPDDVVAEAIFGRC